MYNDGDSRKKRRITFSITAFGVFSLYAILAIQFFRLQITEHEKWSKIARMQHQTTIKEPYRRGIFYSNTSMKIGHIEPPQPLVIDVPKYHLFIDSDMLDPRAKEQMIHYLVKELNIPSTDQKLFRENFYKKSRSRKIFSWMSLEEQSKINCWWKTFSKSYHMPSNALYFVQDYRRSYPFGKLLGQVLHTVREDRDPETNRWIPTGGLELVFNENLSGTEGKRVLLRSPRHSFDTDQIIQEPQNGQDIYLTINHYLQAIAEEELAKGVKKVGAKGGRAIMMDPFTGEIWVMAHYPYFHPGRYRDYYNNGELMECTKIKSITDCYEPGSIMKPITVAIALKANEELRKKGEKPLFFPDEMVRTDNPYFPGRGKPLRDTRPHKYLNLNMAIQKSSNIYVAQLTQGIIEKFGAAWYREQLVRLFGFGKRTGIELPYENAGMVPTPGKTYPNGKLQWSQPTPYSLAMGYNILVNSIQMVRAIAVIANGGELVLPTLIKQTKPPLKERVISKEIASVVTKAMKYTTKPGGPAALDDVPGFTEACKTATTEQLIDGIYSKKRHFSSFIGFVPAENPRFVLLINVDDPEYRYIPGFGTTHFGSKCAGPIFREISKRSLQYLGEPPDDPFGYHKNDPRTDFKAAKWMDEARALEELYQKWNG
jgi:cell division protein FtsI (penicillin-binding protein 3)